MDVACPNDQTRILFVRYVIEPRVMISGPGCVFRGILCPVETAGEGRTHTLPGVTVISSVRYRPTIKMGNRAENSSIVDMWGPGAQVSPFGRTINIVLILGLVDDLSEPDVHTAIQLATFKVATQLAETTRDLTPGRLEVFELSDVDPSLPRVVYILGARTVVPAHPHTDVAWYGMLLTDSLPSFVHPAELLDGAATRDSRRGSGMSPINWAYMNNPVILKLLREHGKRVNFLGVILQRTRFTDEHSKRVSAATTAQMAKLLDAEGAICTLSTPSGNSYMDTMFTVEACEKKGVKTVLITPEWGSNETERAEAFYVPEAVSMVSVGTISRPLKLPAPTKVIGDVKKGEQIELMAEELLLSPWEESLVENELALTYGVDWFGNMNHTCREY
ncbi:MAG: hypothetical protein HY670_07300, partial [Chloroflexi bacterium]|nr:hypothetical protein [Chloroflexota bacterium]